MIEFLTGLVLSLVAIYLIAMLGSMAVFLYCFCKGSK